MHRIRPCHASSTACDGIPITWWFPQRGRTAAQPLPQTGLDERPRLPRTRFEYGRGRLRSATAAHTRSNRSPRGAAYFTVCGGGQTWLNPAQTGPITVAGDRQLPTGFKFEATLRHADAPGEAFALASAMLRACMPVRMRSSGSGWYGFGSEDRCDDYSAVPDWTVPNVGVSAVFARRRGLGRPRCGVAVA